jgi:hypothetical protein
MKTSNEFRERLICAALTGLLSQGRIGTTRAELTEEADAIADAVIAREQGPITDERFKRALGRMIHIAHIGEQSLDGEAYSIRIETSGSDITLLDYKVGRDERIYAEQAANDARQVLIDQIAARIAALLNEQ